MLALMFFSLSTEEISLNLKIFYRYMYFKFYY